MKTRDAGIILVWFMGVALIALMGTVMMTNIKDSNRLYQQRYELCIKSDKQWLDGNCINK
ncbi:hypothetical protein PP459_gp103 [Streptomyces phage Wakanda]|uniref:Uncharacterized protein n=2 Tax=Wakandavirus TaxID=3044854 RepID=A0A6G8R3B3_9CAUD|nr:hypothetical protein PP459_gp103 [Streptomyces phage Wakanda]YP_010652451.1 hypothetical protein PP460_gp107 [Streptomyces phage Muntaha]QIN94130.1 hypothetical protein SEA_WAKANDA_168 [Streptomyces phage Wakanda]QIN94695.1 hypothetical protein SEA_MUNTAHA_170 [Streptomyces phage Muntaha]